jgi:hypothetical protein
VLANALAVFLPASTADVRRWMQRLDRSDITRARNLTRPGACDLCLVEGSLELPQAHTPMTFTC